MHHQDVSSLIGCWTRWGAEMKRPLGEKLENLINPIKILMGQISPTTSIVLNNSNHIEIKKFSHLLSQVTLTYREKKQT